VPQPARVIDLDARRHRSYHYWHVFVPGIGPGQIYGYRASPSYSPRWLRAAGSPGVGIGASLTVAHVSLLDMIGLAGAGG
jgi:hypothetical protein